MNRLQTPLLGTLVRLSIPTMAEEILTTLLQYVDTAMVGRLGEQATASVSVTTTITWLVNSTLLAVGTVILATISQAVGAGDRKRLTSLSQLALFLSVAAGILCGAVSMALSPAIPRWMGAEEAIRRQAAIYFFIISLPMVFRSFTTVLGSAIRATQNTRTPMLINLGANCLNAVLNYFLIYVCRLGVTGAAIASATAYVVSGLLMLFAYRRTAALYWRWEDFSVDTVLLRQCSRMGLPMLGASMTSCLGYVMFAGMVSGSMGTTVFAAHSIAVTAERIFCFPGYGLRTSTSALVGTAAGEHNAAKLRTVSLLSITLTVCMMCLSGVILYLVARPLMALFSPVDAVVALGAEMLRLVSFSEPFFGLMIVLEGIFYGQGRTRCTFVIETFSMWGVRILFTFLCVRVWGLGLRYVWYCMIADNICKAILFVVMFARSGNRIPAVEP